MPYLLIRFQTNVTTTGVRNGHRLPACQQHGAGFDDDAIDGFLRATYGAAADLGKWPRDGLERRSKLRQQD